MGNILIVAGEQSGDLLGASILKAWSGRKKHHFFGCGGPQLAEMGVELVYNIDDLGIFGFIEVIKKCRKLRRYLYGLVGLAVEKNVEHAILIDFPGFNLRLAEQLKKRGVKAHLVNSPQIWASRYGRIKRIKRDLETVLCLYEFEIDIYKKENVSAFFMGHPIVDLVTESKKTLKKVKKKNTILLLPGSRHSEIDRHFPFLLDLAKLLKSQRPKMKIEVVVASEAIDKLMKAYNIPKYIGLTYDGTHPALNRAAMAVACSGTVTLECALFDVPLTIIYATSKITGFIIKRIANLPYVAMINIIRGRFVAKEFLQENMKLLQVNQEVDEILDNENYSQVMRRELKEVRKGLGSGKAALKAAKYFKSLVDQPAE